MNKPATQTGNPGSFYKTCATILFLALILIHMLAPPVRAAQVAQLAPYFPIDSGDFWTYQINGASFTRTAVLPGVVTINGLATKALADDNGFVQYFSNDSFGIRLHRQFTPNVDIGLGFPVNLEVTFSPPVVLQMQ